MLNRDTGIDVDLDRRDALKTIGTAAAGTTLAGVASAKTTRISVGYAADSGKRAAVEAAESVVYDFAFDAVTVLASATALAGLEDRDDVRYVEEEFELEVVGQTLPWGIDRVDADVAHADGETGGDGTDGEGGIDVAVIDTGIDDDHPDLQGNVADPSVDSNHRAYTTCLGLNCNYAWSDDNDHGTHVAGTVTAADNGEGVVGVSTEARLHALKVCGSAGFCGSSDIADALQYAADQGWDVANLSLGGSYSSVIDDAGKYAYDNGVLLVAAAGNDGPCSDCVGYPAANEEFVAVSATTCGDGLADFSSTGPEVELAAPGDSVYSTVIGGYDTFSGTSMAAPHVAGVAAQLMNNGYDNATQTSADAESASDYPGSPGGARGQLQDSAENVGLGADEQGEGLVDAAASLGLDSSDDGTGNGPNC
ncbi:MAG: S8 family serine peptidase [Halolamina sp.]